MGLEPAERKAVSLVHQLNALRNEKAVKRREKQARQRQVRGFLCPMPQSCQIAVTSSMLHETTDIGRCQKQAAAGAEIFLNSAAAPRMTPVPSL